MSKNEIRETLEKQLQLLSERSQNCLTEHELAELTAEMVKILGGKSFGFNLPQFGSIKYLAKGGILEAGSAIVGEKGPELLSLMNGKARVTPLTGNGGESRQTAYQP